MKLNRELAKLGSIVPGCCWRIKYRKGLKQKVAEKDSDDETQETKSSDTTNEETTAKTRSAGKCRVLCCGQKDAINDKVEKYLTNIKDGAIERGELKEILEQFFKQHNISIKLEDDLDLMIEKIDTDGDKQVSKDELKRYLELAIHNYKSNFAAMDDIEEKMFKLKEQSFVELTKPKHFWVTFMEGDAAKNMIQLKKIDFKRHPVPYLRINRKIKIERAKSPSNIIWPNVGFDRMRKCGYLIAVVLVIMIVSVLAQMLFASQISA